jgi:hypothetical protein
MNEPCARLPQFHSRKTGGMNLADCLKRHGRTDCVGCEGYPKEWILSIYPSIYSQSRRIKFWQAVYDWVKGPPDQAGRPLAKPLKTRSSMERATHDEGGQRNPEGCRLLPIDC